MGVEKHYETLCMHFVFELEDWSLIKVKLHSRPLLNTIQITKLTCLFYLRMLILFTYLK